METLNERQIVLCCLKMRFNLLSLRDSFLQAVLQMTLRESIKVVV